MSELSNDSSNKKQRLGRGLGSLLGGAAAGSNLPSEPTQAKPATPQSAQVPAEGRIWQVAIDKLQPGEFQPRVHFNKEKLEELAASIKKSGILQPIVARRLDQSRFEIIAGERRWRAAQLAGAHEVPVIIKTLKNQEALELAIIENIQREDLNAIEEAEAYQRLINEFQLTQQQVAERVGKERATVANSLRLLNLTPEVRNMLAKNEISTGHAKVLLSIADAKNQVALAIRAHKENLTVRQLEKLTQTKQGAQSSHNMEGSVTQRLISGLAEELQKLLGTKVTIDYAQSKGKIAVHFYSDEELTEIVEKLKVGCKR